MSGSAFRRAAASFQPKAATDSNKVAASLGAVDEQTREVFSLFDKNKDGSMQRSDLSAALECLGHDISDAQLAELMEADADVDGTLNYGEFLALLDRKTLQDNKRAETAELSEAFRVFDRDGDGRISVRDLRAFMRLLGEVSSDARLEAMMAQADREGRGSVDFEQFSRAMLS